MSTNKTQRQAIELEIWKWRCGMLDARTGGNVYVLEVCEDRMNVELEKLSALDVEVEVFIDE